MQLTALSKTILAGLLVGVVIFSVRNWAPDLWNTAIDMVAPAVKTQGSVVPNAAALPEIGASSVSDGLAAAPLPGTTPVSSGQPAIRMLIWAWNAQMGLLLANGGFQTTEQSLMHKHGVTLNLVRQDDVSQMQNELIKFAVERQRGSLQPTSGAHFVAIMGDGAGQFLAAINPQLERLGPEYRAQVIGSAGYSRGEDKFMGPPAWKTNPQAARGGVVSGYLRDGDWNIAMKWLGDNQIPNNPDEKTYDPDALNWISADSYIDAAQKYVSGYSESRPVVKNGERTGATKSVKVDGVVTWTPGDVTVAKERGGLVSIVSTREYSAQMPNTIIGIGKWMEENRSQVEQFLTAIFEGGDQVKTYAAALKRASEISAAVYKEETPDYWEKYFHMVLEKDKQGLDVELGGSSVNNLADNLYLFGRVPGSANLFAATYTVFGDIVVQQYPRLVSTYPPVTAILNTSFVDAIAQRATPGAVPDTPKFTASTPMTSTIGRRSWNITFETGKASFTANATQMLENLFNDLLIAGSAIVEIHGHTDNVGDAQANRSLSERRAFTVKKWLEAKSASNFPQGRIRITAHGDANPIEENSTEEGRARNRRVEIIIGTSN